jgi:hypothetical protein
MFTNSSGNEALGIRYKIILLLCLPALAYLPVLSSGFFIFDDFGIVDAIKKVSSNEALTFLWTTEGRYWRPVIMLSFLFDINVFDANSALMHLHNVILHTANTFFVFLLVRDFSSTSNKNSKIPLLTAAIFALHPINTEAVAWIAARTDLYATFFSLAGLFLYSKSINTNHKLYVWGSAFLFLLGGCSKEIGVPLFLAAVIGILLVNSEQKSFYDTRQKFTGMFLSMLPYLVFGAGYFLLRKSAFQSVDKSLAKVVAITQQTGPSILEQIVTGLTALGFYFKKIFIPTPLNFAIDSVAGLYLWVGILIIIVLLIVLMKGDRNSIFLVVALFAIAPALLNAILQIAWTPYAERYLYLPTAMICAFCGTKLSSLRLPPRVLPLALTPVLCVFLTITVQRNLQWMNYSELLEDAIKRSPDNISLSINYAIVVEEKEPLAARTQLLHALTLGPKKQVISKVLATIALNTMKDPELARRDLDIFFQNDKAPSKEILDLMIATNNARLAKTEDAVATRLIKTELTRSHMQRYDLTQKPSDLFNAVQLVQNEDDISSVKTKLREILKNSTNDIIKQEAANHLLHISSKKLGNEQR